MSKNIHSITWTRKPDAIYTDYEGTPVSKITYVLDDSSWTVWPHEEMFKGMCRTFSSLKAAEYYSLVIALEMQSMGWFNE